MNDRFFRALRAFILGAAAAGVGAFTALNADDASPAPSTPPAPSADVPKQAEGNARPGVPAPDKPAPLAKVFTPTQEISPDQEIDFPADL